MSSFFRCFAPAVQVDRARWHIELWKVKSCTIGHCRRPIFGNGKEQKNMEKFRELTTSQPTNKHIQTFGLPFVRQWIPRLPRTPCWALAVSESLFAFDASHPAARW